MKWKVRLDGCIGGTSTGQLKVEVVGRDDQCTLGNWNYGLGGKRFSGNPAFAVLKARHAQFHRCVGEVLEVAGRGDLRIALHMLEEGAYPDASDQVADGIVRCSKSRGRRPERADLRG